MHAKLLAQGLAHNKHSKPWLLLLVGCLSLEARCGQGRGRARLSGWTHPKASEDLNQGLEPKKAIAEGKARL